MILIKIRKWIGRISVFLSSILCAAMMIILFANVVLRYIPGIGGFSWYMESSQYLNVWSMFVVGLCLSAYGDHLRVNMIEDLCAKNRISRALQKAFVNLLMALFYGLVTYAFVKLTQKGLKVRISTMQSLYMGYVYMLIPVATGMSAIAYVLDLIVSLAGLNEDSLKKEG